VITYHPTDVSSYLSEHEVRRSLLINVTRSSKNIYFIQSFIIKLLWEKYVTVFFKNDKTPKINFIECDKEEKMTKFGHIKNQISAKSHFHILF
jgi:hypothetical protein